MANICVLLLSCQMNEVCIPTQSRTINAQPLDFHVDALLSVSHRTLTYHLPLSLSPNLDHDRSCVLTPLSSPMLTLSLTSRRNSPTPPPPLLLRMGRPTRRPHCPPSPLWRRAQPHTRRHVGWRKGWVRGGATLPLTYSTLLVFSLYPPQTPQAVAPSRALQVTGQSSLATHPELFHSPLPQILTQRPRQRSPPMREARAPQGARPSGHSGPRRWSRASAMGSGRDQMSLAPVARVLGRSSLACHTRPTHQSSSMNGRLT